jgi:hypothetical protein
MELIIGLTVIYLIATIWGNLGQKVSDYLETVGFSEDGAFFTYYFGSFGLLLLIAYYLDW